MNKIVFLNKKNAFSILSMLLVLTFVICIFPYSHTKADEPGVAEEQATEEVIKDKNTKKISLKGNVRIADLKQGITVKKIKVSSKWAKIKAGKYVKVLNLTCLKKEASVFIEALDGSEITVNLKKKTFLTIKGSSSAKIKINVLCEGCVVDSDIPVELSSSYPIKLGTKDDIEAMTKENYTGTSSLEKLYNIDWWKENKTEDKLILTSDEIAAFNNSNIGSGCGLVDMDSFDDLTDKDVIEMIEDYLFPSKEYVKGRKITEEEIQKIKDNRNIPEADNEASKVKLRYAITTENASIRAFPTDIFLTNEAGKYDYMQETGINYGEPLIVLWDSKDEKWSFVQTYCYNGWMKKSLFALCSKDDFDFVKNSIYSGNVFCILKTDIYELNTAPDGSMTLRSFIDQSEPMTGSEQVLFRMGTYLPCIDGKAGIVIRNKNGKAEFKRATIVKNVETADNLDKNDDFIQPISSVLELTEKNLLDIAENALGTPYSWGDIDEKGMDCSSTLQGIFKCFGLLLPRNSSQQIKLKADIINLGEFSKEEKLKSISELPLGSILYMPGHVMMYLGEYDGVPYIIHNTTDSARDDNGITVYNSCVLTSVGVGKSGYTLFDKITYAVVF